LHSPKAPYAGCDIGQHIVQFALHPHIGNCQSANVVAAVYKFNNPLCLSASPNTYDLKWLGQSFISFETYPLNTVSDNLPPLVVNMIKFAQDEVEI